MAAFVLLTSALVAGVWLYRDHLPPPPAMSGSQAARPIARIVVQPQSAAAETNPANEAESSSAQEPATLPKEISVHPLEDFREETRKALLHEPGMAAPTDLRAEAASNFDPSYRRLFLQFLDAAENSSPERRPAMLLAADFMAQAIWCPSEARQQCAEISSEFAQHNLTLAYNELGGGFYYKRDLLWRVWQDYPASDWGERAFVLLLDQGWDTSGTCVKGSDQFRQVIRQGEAFLEQHPASPHRAYVVHLLAQAYATWWSLSNPPSNGMSDYVDPSQYQEGAAEAGRKAIADFEQVLRIAPGSTLSEYAEQVLPPLRERQLPPDAYRFFCVYD